MSQPTGSNTATPPGFLGPAAWATDAAALLQGEDAAHSPPARPSQRVSCKRQAQPCSRCLTSTALLLAACCVPRSTSQRKFQQATSAASSFSRSHRARNSATVMSPSTSCQLAAAGTALRCTAL
eukprot:429632-Alexandrium_andersonii.AAC.1